MKLSNALFVPVLAFAVAAFAAAPPDRTPLVIGPVLAQGPLEQSFIDLERQIPGFAGWYFERDGTAVALLSDPSRAAEAVERVGRIAAGRAARGRVQATAKEPRVEIRAAQYSFSELASIRHLMSQELPKGVRTIDVDESQNVVTFGVRDDAVAGELRALAAKLRIPAGALAIRHVDAPQLRSTLTDYIRPIPAGVGITYGGGALCTVGINTIWNNDPAWAGFLTAAHCGVPWGVSTTVFDQGGSRVGTEGDDPAPWPQIGCPPNVYCRYSDAAVVYYDANVRSSANGRNTLALPQGSPVYVSSPGQSGPTTYGQTVEIVGESSYTGGEYVEKIGAASGWTYGHILPGGTCVNVQQEDHPYWGVDVWLLCQGVADVHSRYGDSGAPVIRWYNVGGVPKPHFAGIIWGGGSNYESYISSAWNLQQDFPGFTFYY